MLKINIEVNKIVKREIGREIHLDIGEGRVLEFYKFTNADDSADDYEAGIEEDSDETREIMGKLSEEDREQVEQVLEDIEL